MYLDDLGEIIAVRELSMVEDGKADRKVEISIGKPHLSPDSGGYLCPFQIAGIGREEIKYAAGIDAIQALQLVMVMVGATLQFLNDQSGGRLRWEGGSEGDLGFPITV